MEDWDITDYLVVEDIKHLVYSLIRILDGLLVTICLTGEPERVRAKVLPSLKIETCNEISANADKIKKEYKTWERSWEKVLIKDEKWGGERQEEEESVSEVEDELGYDETIDVLDLGKQAVVYINDLIYMLNQKKIKK